METRAYHRLSKNEQVNWYYLSRQYGLKKLFSKFLTIKNKRILDIGCGTGGTTNFLFQFGEVTGLESSDLAIKLINQNYPHLNIIQGNIIDIKSKFENSCFDLCSIFSVLYHKGVSDPSLVLKDVYLKLNKGGFIFWQEPAYPIFRREMDDDVHGNKRFYPSEMCRFIKEAGFKIQFKTHLTFWIFPIALLIVIVYKFKKKKYQKNEQYHSPDLKNPHPFVNKILYIFACFEWWISINLFRLPAGVSYFIVAQKTSE